MTAPKRTDAARFGPITSLFVMKEALASVRLDGETRVWEGDVTCYDVDEALRAAETAQDERKDEE